MPGHPGEEIEMSVFVILNHNLTQDQREELEEKFGRVVELDAEEKAMWAQIPAEGDHLEVQKHIWPILMKVNEHDAVICQGEFTAFCAVFTMCQPHIKTYWLPAPSGRP